MHLNRIPQIQWSFGSYEHLTNSVANNFISRWLIRLANRNMNKSGSKWKLKIRYRKPIDGVRYGSGGTLRRENAKKIALYLTRR